MSQSQCALLISLFFICYHLDHLQRYLNTLMLFICQTLSIETLQLPRRAPQTGVMELRVMTTKFHMEALYPTTVKKCVTGPSSTFQQ